MCWCVSQFTTEDAHMQAHNSCPHIQTVGQAEENLSITWIKIILISHRHTLMEYVTQVYATDTTLTQF